MKKVLILRHVEIEGPGTIGEFLENKKIAYSILDVFKDNGAVLSEQDLDQVGAVVVMGGPMNVYEELKFPFLSAEKYFIRELVMKKIPLLGICLGAQLIASALGARVKRAHFKEIGWYDMRIGQQGKSDPLMKGIGEEIKVFQWHEDTFDLPAHAILLARDNNMNQAFRFKDTTWGLQFHVEVTDEMIGSWVNAHIKEGHALPYGPEMVKKYLEVQGDFKRQADILYSAFFSHLY